MANQSTEVSQTFHNVFYDDAHCYYLHLLISQMEFHTSTPPHTSYLTLHALYFCHISLTRMAFYYVFFA
jgi:hypothetical protein